jgi:hypothetical protein
MAPSPYPTPYSYRSSHPVPVSLHVPTHPIQGLFTIILFSSRASQSVQSTSAMIYRKCSSRYTKCDVSFLAHPQCRCALPCHVLSCRYDCRFTALALHRNAHHILTVAGPPPEPTKRRFRLHFFLSSSLTFFSYYCTRIWHECGRDRLTGHERRVGELIQSESSRVLSHTSVLYCGEDPQQQNNCCNTKLD